MSLCINSSEELQRDDERISQDFLRFPETERHLMEKHSTRKTILKQRRNELREQIQGIERDIIEEQHQFGVVYNGRSVPNRLPNEILALVFQALHRPGQFTGIPEDPLPEIAVSHVCSRWRRLALSIPTLWSFFCAGSGESDLVSRERLVAYLERSKDVPLNLWLQLGGDNIIEDILPILARHLHRLRRFQLQSGHIPTIEALSMDLRRVSDAPFLETFIMRLRSAIGGVEAEDTILDLWPDNWLLKKETPTLRYLHLDEISIRHFRPNLTSIAHLRLEMSYVPSPLMVTTSVFDDILRSPHLQTLSVIGPYIYAAENLEPGPVIEAKSLQHFRCDGDSRLPQYFLSRVSSPSLESITFYHPVFLSPTFTTPTPRFPRLNTLACYHPVVPPDCLPPFLDMLALVPTVKHVVLASSSSVLDEVAIRALTVGSLSNVEEATIRIMHGDFEPLGRLIRALPKLVTLRVPEMDVRLIPAIVAGRGGKNRITVVPVDATKPLIHPYWPPGVDWVAKGQGRGWGIGISDTVASVYQRYEYETD